MSESSQTATEEVHVGHDGWLLLTGGNNNVLSFFTDENAFPDSMEARWVNLLKKRKDRCESIGALYYHIVAPEKLSVYADKYRGELPLKHRIPSVRLPEAAKAAGIDVVVDLLPTFAAEKDAHKLYWKTDTHWTFEGCFAAFKALCKRAGVADVPDLDARPKLKGNLVLDLGGKMNPPVQEEFATVRVLRDAKRVAVNSIVAFKERTKRENDGGLHVGSNVVFCNWSASAIQKTVMLFGDSFSEYRPHLLTGMLAETFKEVHFVWSTNIDWSYVDRVKPDILITEAAERFMRQVPTDTYDLVAYETAHVASYLAQDKQ